jgi:hypothetical protein
MRIKNIFALIICSFIISKTNAQISDESKYEFGLRIAPQVSWSKPDSKSITDGGISLDWNYGFHVAKKFTSRYAIALEVNVINMTSKIKITDSIKVFSPNELPAGASTSDMSLNYHLRYLQIPILFKMTTDPFKDKWKAYGEFGLGLSFLLRSKVDVSSSVLKLNEVDVDNPDNGDIFYINSDKFDKNYSTQINMLRPSFIIGGGLVYDLVGNTKAYVGLRYDNGLADFMDADKWTAINSFTALNIGIIF